MSIELTTHVPGMKKCQGMVLDTFGQDCTGKIKYYLNQQGFRSRIDYTRTPSVAFFGCSLVFGVGVDQDNVFSSYFENSHNYGLAGLYNNQDVYQTVKQFLNSSLYNNTPVVVVWHSRDSENLDQYYQELNIDKIYHFFCGAKLQHPNCFSMIKNIDSDVSGTHMGPKTHRLFYKTLCSLLNQS
jgi:hypothetical protein